MRREEPEKTLVDGRPVTEDHLEINPLTGQQKDYVVLSAAERAKGFVRPLRTEYIHLGKVQKLEGADGSIFDGPRYGGCGVVTRMSLPIAETWARDIHFYSHTFCVRCKTHLPVDEFVWVDPSTGEPTNEVLGS